MNAKSRPLISLFTLAAIVLAALPTEAQGQGRRGRQSIFDRRHIVGEPGWSGLTELRFVMTDGNAQTETLGFFTSSSYGWDNSWLTFNASAFRQERTTVQRIAAGLSPEDFELIEIENTELDAERYDLDVRFQHRLTPRTFWFLGGGWERNEFSGIQDRYFGWAGLGHLIKDSDRTLYRIDYGVSYTEEERGAGRALPSDGYPGIRVVSYLGRDLTPTTRFINRIALDTNLDETDDYRADMTNTLSVELSERFRLRLSVRSLYENERFGSLPLRDPDTRELTGDRVRIELDEMDTIVTIGLVAAY